MCSLVINGLEREIKFLLNYGFTLMQHKTNVGCGMQLVIMVYHNLVFLSELLPILISAAQLITYCGVHKTHLTAINRIFDTAHDRTKNIPTNIVGWNNYLLSLKTKEGDAIINNCCDHHSPEC